MLRELEETHDSSDGEEVDDVLDPWVPAPALSHEPGGLEDFHQSVQVKGERCNKVDDVVWGLEECGLGGTEDEAGHKLEQEPNVADELDDDEDAIGFVLDLIHNYACQTAIWYGSLTLFSWSNDLCQILMLWTVSL